MVVTMVTVVTAATGATTATAAIGVTGATGAITATAVIAVTGATTVGELGGLNDYIKKDEDLEGSWQAQRSKEGCDGQVTTHRPAAVTAGCNCSQLLAAYTLR